VLEHRTYKGSEKGTENPREYIHSNPYRNKDHNDSSPLYSIFLGFIPAHGQSCSKIAYRHERKPYRPECGEKCVEATVIEAPLDVGEEDKQDQYSGYA